jgi:hypothetical protein
MLCLCLPYAPTDRCPQPWAADLCCQPSRNAAAHVPAHAIDPARGVHASCTSLRCSGALLGFRRTPALQVRPGGRGANAEVLVPTEAPFVLAGPAAFLRPGTARCSQPFGIQLLVPYEPLHERRLSTAHAVPHRPPRPRRRTYGSARSAWQSVRCSVRCCRIGQRRTLVMSCRRCTPARAVACVRACVPLCAFVRACVVLFEGVFMSPGGVVALAFFVNLVRGWLRRRRQERFSPLTIQCP